MKELHMLTFLLVVIGALNWGLVGLFNYNLVDSLLGFSPALIKIVYVLVGLSAIVELVQHKDCCKCCSEKMKEKK